MAEILGAIGAQTFVVLVVALVGLIPVALFYRRTYRWFVVAYGFLFVAAMATNLENVVLPDILNYTEHLVGNMGAGLAFAAAAYMYRKEHLMSGDEQGETGH